jgi:hypothetical protein
VVEVHEGIGRPQTSSQFFASYDFTWLIEQHDEDLKGLILEPDLGPAAAQFPSPQVGLEDAELDHLRPVTVHSHRTRLIEPVKFSRTSAFQPRHLDS